MPSSDSNRPPQPGAPHGHPSPPPPEKPHETVRLEAKPTPSAMLDGWLGRCYGAPRGLTPSTSHQDFSEALQGDSDLMTAAQQRLAELEALAAACQGDVGKRCALSAAALATLRALLPQS